MVRSNEERLRTTVKSCSENTSPNGAVIGATIAQVSPIFTVVHLHSYWPLECWVSLCVYNHSSQFSIKGPSICVFLFIISGATKLYILSVIWFFFFFKHQRNVSYYAIWSNIIINTFCDVLCFCFLAEYKTHKTSCTGWRRFLGYYITFFYITWCSHFSLKILWFFDLQEMFLCLIPNPKAREACKHCGKTVEECLCYFSILSAEI